jgi:hypothetical protein
LVESGFSRTPVHKKGDAARPLLAKRRRYLFFAAFFFPPFAFFAIENASLHRWIAGRPVRQRTLPPGTSARRMATSLRGLTRARVARRASSNLRRWKKNRNKKNGVLDEHPEGQSREITASSRPFSFRPWLPSSPFFSPQVVVTQPPTNHLVVTTGGLSHPPSYQM